MKKKWAAFLTVVLLLACAAGFAVYRAAAGQRPFAGIAAGDIVSARVEMVPPSKGAQLDQEAIEELAGILRVATVYRRDDSYREYNGQAAVYTLVLADGSTVTIQACTPFLLIDGVGYRARYEPCQALSALGNEQIEREGQP